MIHACKSPCHQQAVGYRGSLVVSHPNYLALQQEHDLYLDIIDPPVPLFKVETFERFLAFPNLRFRCILNAPLQSGRIPRSTNCQQSETALDRTIHEGACYSDSAALFQALGGGWWNGQLRVEPKILPGTAKSKTATFSMIGRVRLTPCWMCWSTPQEIKHTDHRE